MLKIKTNVIKKELALQNKSLGWLAKRLKITQSWLSMIIHNNANPSPKVRESLLKQFPHLEWEDLFEYIDDGLDEKSQPMAL